MLCSNSHRLNEEWKSETIEVDTIWDRQKKTKKQTSHELIRINELNAIGILVQGFLVDSDLNSTHLLI